MEMQFQGLNAFLNSIELCFMAVLCFVFLHNRWKIIDQYVELNQRLDRLIVLTARMQRGKNKETK